MSVVALIVAAGRGSRAGEGVPKQFRSLAGRPVLVRTLEAFLSHRHVDRTAVVIHPDDMGLYQASVADFEPALSKRLLPPVFGGETRQDSVRLGLEALAHVSEQWTRVCADADLRLAPNDAPLRSISRRSGSGSPSEHAARPLKPWSIGGIPTAEFPVGSEALAAGGADTVLVHDAARPFVEAGLIDRAIEAGGRGAAVPGIPVTDTIKVTGTLGEVVSTPDRSTLRAVQTPQAFPFGLLLDAHRKAAAAGLHGFTDDGALAEWAGLPVRVFEGDPANVKLTHPADFSEAERRLKGEAMTYVTRLGTGFDVHAFSEGDHVWLGGIKVPHDHGVLAHSDGDVILHALTDAILGALADGDIGTHFPPSDPQWRGASSDRFLAHAADLVRRRGGIIDHLDSTLLCEKPRLGPHREAMRRRIAEIAGLRVDQVSLKATTTEKLGFTGRSEGIAAQAAATIRLPESAA